jgi:hypothetical protein
LGLVLLTLVGVINAAISLVQRQQGAHAQAVGK